MSAKNVGTIVLSVASLLVCGVVAQAGDCHNNNYSNYGARPSGYGYGYGYGGGIRQAYRPELGAYVTTIPRSTYFPQPSPNYYGGYGRSAVAPRSHWHDTSHWDYSPQFGYHFHRDGHYDLHR